MGYIIGLILALICTVLVLIFITPDNKRDGLNPFFRFLHDLFNFKWLLVEKLLKLLYVFATLMAVFSGFITLFSDFVAGLLLMLLGPIAMRFLFESLMMFVLVVKNVISINNKLSPAAAPDATSRAKAAPAEYVFCGNCGTRYDRSQGPCPNCGSNN